MGAGDGSLGDSAGVGQPNVRSTVGPSVSTPAFTATYRQGAGDAFTEEFAAVAPDVVNPDATSSPGQGRQVSPVSDMAERPAVGAGSGGRGTGGGTGDEDPFVSLAEGTETEADGEAASLPVSAEHRSTMDPGGLPASGGAAGTAGRGDPAAGSDQSVERAVPDGVAAAPSAQAVVLDAAEAPAAPVPGTGAGQPAAASGSTTEVEAAAVQEETGLTPDEGEQPAPLAPLTAAAAALAGGPQSGVPQQRLLTPANAAVTPPADGLAESVVPSSPEASTPDTRTSVSQGPGRDDATQGTASEMPSSYRPVRTESEAPPTKLDTAPSPELPPTVIGAAPDDDSEFDGASIFSYVTDASSNDSPYDSDDDERQEALTSGGWDATKGRDTAQDLGDDLDVIPLREAIDAAPGDVYSAVPQPASAMATERPSATGAESAPPRARLDGRPRIVVRSAFDVRRFTHGGGSVTDLTVRLAFRPGDGRTDTDAVMARVRQGVEEFYNRPGYKLPNGDRLHVTVEPVGPDDNPHLTVEFVGRDQEMNQRAWWADADPVKYAHELAHQLFLRDETRNESNPDRLHAPGSLLGPFDEQAPGGLAQSGLRERHLQLWAAVAGDIAAHTSPEGTSWADARRNATAELRERVWVDPVSLPEVSPQMEPDGSVPPPLPLGRGLPTPAEAIPDAAPEPAPAAERLLADSRSTGEEFRAAVRQVAENVPTEGADPAEPGTVPPAEDSTAGDPAAVETSPPRPGSPDSGVLSAVGPKDEPREPLPVSDEPRRPLTEASGAGNGVSGSLSATPTAPGSRPDESQSDGNVHDREARVDPEPVPDTGTGTGTDTKPDTEAVESAEPDDRAASRQDRPPSPDEQRHGGTATNTPATPRPDVVPPGDDPPGDDPAGRAPTAAELSRVILEFGKRPEGTHGLEHLTPVPEETVVWLQDQMIKQVEGDLGEDADFHALVRATVTSRFLSGVWEGLFSERGVPIRASYRGHTYCGALRLGLSEPQPGDPDIEEMHNPDGPPVNIQRWVFGTSEVGNTTSAHDLRSLNLGYAHTWRPSKGGRLKRVTFAPTAKLTFNQTSTTVMASRAVQPMVLLRVRERSRPYDYRMNWQFKKTAGLHDALTTVGDEEWRTLRRPDEEEHFTVWVPQHLIDADNGAGVRDDGDPEKRPAPLATVTHHVPLLAIESVPHADQLLADVLSSFKTDLANISEASLDELRHFFGEGNLRGTSRLMTGGRYPSPTLIAKDGSVIGVLGVHKVLHERKGPDHVAGPPSQNSVLESHILRSLKLAGSASVENGAGASAGLTFGIAQDASAPGTETDTQGVALTGQVDVQHQFKHILNSGGSARISRSLRTSKPLFRENADAVYDITLVPAAGAERGPEPGSPLATGRKYREILRVPSEATVSGVPKTKKYLPPEVLSLRSLNVSTTPLKVDGTEEFFQDLEIWMRKNGFLPSHEETLLARYQGLAARVLDIQRLYEALDGAASALDAQWLYEALGGAGSALYNLWLTHVQGPAAARALHIQQLNNLRKLDLWRAEVGQLGALGESVEDGSSEWFVLPTVLGGTQRFTVEITTKPRQVEGAEDGGVTHDMTLKDVQTLNYTASTMAGDEQFSRSAWGHTWTGQVSGTNVLNETGDSELQGITGEGSITRQPTKITGSSAGTGHEFYLLSPTADGTEVFTMPVTHRAVMSWTHGEAPAPREMDGKVTVALPTYRTLSEASDVDPPPGAVARPLTEEDEKVLATALRPPTTAIFDRLDGSEAIRVAVNSMLKTLVAAAGEDADGERTMPGAFPEDADGEPEPTETAWGGEAVRNAVNGMVEGGEAIRNALRGILETLATVAEEDADGERTMPGAFPEDADGEPEQAAEPTGTAETADGAASGTLGADLDRRMADLGHRIADLADIVWQWTKQRAVGEDVLHPASSAQEAIRTGFSSIHLIGNAQRIARDSYVVENIASSGVLAGKDITVEVRGYLTDVKALPAPGVMDYERWVQSVDASAHIDNVSRGHSYGGGIAGNYSVPGRRVVPSGRYLHRRTVTEVDTVNDNSPVMRVTTENDVSPHRFSAKVTYVVTVSMGQRNALIAMVSPNPTLSVQQIVEPSDATAEFILNDNDLINHPEFRLAGVPAPPDPGPYDRMLPPGMVQSGKLPFSSVVEVEIEAPAPAEPEAPALVETEAPAPAEPEAPTVAEPQPGTAAAQSPPGADVPAEPSATGSWSPRSAFETLIRDTVEKVAPGVTKPGRSNYLPGVRTRINEHGTWLGLATLPNAGPEARTIFHFVHRSAAGPKLVQVSLNARPVGDLAAARGRSALKTAGLDNVLGHTNGDGGTLPKPGTTRHSRNDASSDQLEFSPMAQVDSHRIKTTLGVIRKTENQEAAISTVERRIWERTVGDTSEFDLLYEYSVTVESVPLDEALIVRLPRLLAEWLGWAGRKTGLAELAAHAYGLVPDEWQASLQRLFDSLPFPPQHVSGSVHAMVRTRFSGSETPRDTGITTQPPVRRAEPAVFTSDPSKAPPPPPDGAVVIDMEMGENTREVFSGEPWLPKRPFALYDFDAVPELVKALREVDPDLDDGLLLGMQTSTSVEGTLLRLAQIAATGRLTQLTPAATAPYLGRPGSDRNALQMLIFAPRSESDSRDTAIDRIEIANDGAFTQADLSLSPSTDLNLSPSLKNAGQDRLALKGPLAGSASTVGQTWTGSAPRREMLRYGTPMAGAAEGVRGHEVWAAGLLKVVGPKGTRWVTGNMILRTTEAPPGFEASPPVDGTQEEAPQPADTPPPGQVPGVRRGVAERQWTARNVSEEDLPEDLRGLDVGGSVSVAELRAAGIKLPLGREVEAQLSGLIGLSALEPLDQVRVLMVRPGPWPPVLDTIEAATSRRIWALAAAEFAAEGEISADGTTEADVNRAGDTAVGPVLTPEPGPVPTDPLKPGTSPAAH
ncbi:hypothetical protein ACIREO_08950 [Streptomyces sp. NPDC102441]|uniref:hypothetical protein n=1 Tax=Streptomyces sp. NPDC102441 TaxID=3366176 RepID=UPI00380A19F5